MSILQSDCFCFDDVINGSKFKTFLINFSNLASNPIVSTLPCDAFFYRYEPHVTKVNKNILIAKWTSLEELRDIQNCMAGKSYKLNSSWVSSMVQFVKKAFYESVLICHMGGGSSENFGAQKKGFPNFSPAAGFFSSWSH